MYVHGRSGIRLNFIFHFKVFCSVFECNFQEYQLSPALFCIVIGKAMFI